MKTHQEVGGRCSRSVPPFFGGGRRMLGVFVVLVSLFLVTSIALAEIYYVSLKGDDANDGTSEVTAFRTITKGALVARAGDTVLIEPGDYGSEQAEVANSGRKEAPITIKAEVPGEVVLRGSGGGTGLRIIGKSYIVVDGIKFINYGAGLAVKLSSYITVTNSIFQNNQRFGIYLYGGRPSKSHHLLFTRNQFLDYAESGPGSPVSGSGIQDYGLALYFASDVKVTHNYFYGHHHQALSFKAVMRNSIAANNVFEGFYYSAIQLGQNSDNEEEGSLRSRGLVVEENVFRPSPEYRAKSGVVVSNVTDAVVRNNFMDSLYGEDQRSKSFFPGAGIQVTQLAIGTKIYGNVIINARKPALLIRADSEIYNNTIVGSDVALEIAEGVSAVVRNNIFYRNKKAVGKAEPFNPMRRKEYTRMMKNGSMWTIPVDLSKESTFDHNDWFPDWSKKGASDISVDPKFVGPFVPLGFNPYTPGGRSTPSGPIELTPYEPKFVPNFERMYAYRLAKGSPCINRGVDVGLPFVGAAPDLGAFEFGSDGE